MVTYIILSRSIQSLVRLGRDGVEQEEALRTCEKFLAVQCQPWLNTSIRRKDLQAQGNVPIPVRIILLEHICHALQADARLHEQIK